MTCCEPLYTVVSVDSTTDTVTLTVNKLFNDIGQNAPFKCCINIAQVPEASNARIVLTDGTFTYNCVYCNGNYLRADSLRKFICKQTNSVQCGRYAFNCYRGSDTSHIMFFHRFCPSSSQNAQTATQTASVQAS